MKLLVVRYDRERGSDDAEQVNQATTYGLDVFYRHQVKLLADGWTAVTRDKSLSAQCEHSVGVTATGVEVFTLSPKGLFNPASAKRGHAAK